MHIHAQSAVDQMKVILATLRPLKIVCQAQLTSPVDRRAGRMADRRAGRQAGRQIEGLCELIRLLQSVLTLSA